MPQAALDAAPSPAEPDLSVRIGALRLATPVMPASGCFGPELAPLLPVAEVGSAVTKTVFATPRAGNPAPRVTELDGALYNSVGIPSHGPAGFVRDLYPRYAALGVPVIVSIGGLRPGEYGPLADDLAAAIDAAGLPPAAALELNVSCPNLERDGAPIGADPHVLARVVADVRARTALPLLVKLPPTVPAIAEPARAAEAAGADALTVANSYPSLPAEPGPPPYLGGTPAPGRFRPALGNVIGGLSGAPTRALSLRLVWQAARAVGIPVVGCGGVGSAADVCEYLAMGATAVQVGTATFARPAVMAEIVRELRTLCREAGAPTPARLVGREVRA